MTAAKSSSPEAVRDCVLAYVFIVALLLYFTAGSLFLRHHDLGWHIAAGDLIRQTHAIPQTDPWSFTANGYRWLNISWLWDVLASALFSAGGFGALIAMTIFIGACVSALLAYRCLSSGGGVVLTAIGTLWVAITLPLYEGPLNYVLAAAPQSISLLFFMLFWSLLDHAWQNRRLRKLWPLLPLMVVWVNMHGGFLLAFVLLAAYVAQAWQQKQWVWVKYLALLGVICALALLINPLGWRVVEGALRSLLGLAKHGISEWAPFTFGHDWFSTGYLLIVILCMRWWDSRIPLAQKLLSVFFLIAGLKQERNYCYFMLASLPPLVTSLKMHLESAYVCSGRFRAIESQCETECADARKRAVVLAGLALLLLPAAAMLRWPAATTFPDDIAPKEEIAYLVEHFPGENVYNHWNFGGFMIFYARDKLHVIIDGRAETAYPPDLLEKVITYNQEREIIDRYHLKVALMPRYIPDQLTYFETSPDWELAFSGKVGNVYVRRDAATQQKGAH